jgi:hypothetical protein
MGNQYMLGRSAIIKLVLHAAKFPHTAVNGVLLGSVSGGSAGEQQVDIVDAVPLFHSHHSLAPALEVALAQVTSTPLTQTHSQLSFRTRLVPSS